MLFSLGWYLFPLDRFVEIVEIVCAAGDIALLGFLELFVDLLIIGRLFEVKSILCKLILGKFIDFSRILVLGAAPTFSTRSRLVLLNKKAAFVSESRKACWLPMSLPIDGSVSGS